MSFYINEQTGGLLETADDPPAGYISVQYPTNPETLRTNKKLQREAILADREIRQLCINSKPLIAPFAERYDWHGISGGLDNNGYCISLGDQWKINAAPIIDTADLKDKNNDRFIIDNTGDQFILLPNSCVLATSREIFDLPDGIMALSFGKSTLARINLVTHVTPLEAGWRGHLTIEIANLNRRTKIVLNAGMPITQIVFFRVSGSAYTGQYQNQPPVPVVALGNKTNG